VIELYLRVIFGDQGDRESVLGLGESRLVQSRDQNVVKSGGRGARLVVYNLHFAGKKSVLMVTNVMLKQPLSESMDSKPEATTCSRNGLDH